MFVLDTNVIAEIAKIRAEQRVLNCVEAADERRLYLTSTILGELARGVYRLPKGRRRSALENWLENVLKARFETRVLAFDAAAATIWGRLMGEGERAGRTPPDRDCQIAAVTLLHGMTLVTRNVLDFERLGLVTLNPWEAS